jgi:hypothetical protein
MYTSINFKTKKALKEAIKMDKYITVYQPNDMFGAETRDGECFLEGPHYPEMHRWYAKGVLKDGRLVRVV